MQGDENGTDLSAPTERPAGRRPLKLVLGFLRGLLPGIGIVLLLNFFNHQGWFALLAGVFGMLLYDGLVFVQWLTGRGLLGWVMPQRPGPEGGIEGEEARKAFIAIASRGLLIDGLLALGGLVGLFLFSSQQQPLFALVSGALGLLFCINAFRFLAMAGITVLILFVLSKWENRPGPSTNEADRTEDEPTE